MYLYFIHITVLRIYKHINKPQLPILQLPYTRDYEFKFGKMYDRFLNATFQILITTKTHLFIAGHSPPVCFFLMSLPGYLSYLGVTIGNNTRVNLIDFTYIYFILN